VREESPLDHRTDTVCDLLLSPRNEPVQRYSEETPWRMRSKEHPDGYVVCYIADQG
jgi:hypothetical protein